jgi:hypothetical protein
VVWYYSFLAAAEQEPDGEEAEQQLEAAHGSADTTQQPLSGAWYSVDVWSWKSEIAVVVLVCILVSKQRAAGRVERGPSTQREREAGASLTTARRQAEREAAATTTTTHAVATATGAAAAGAAAATAPATAAADTIAAAAAVVLPACVVCMEAYSAAGGIVPRMMQCGHAFCEVCLDRMLEPLALKKGRKRLPCPTCRKECAVKGGRAAELPTVYDMMGA